MLSSCLCQYYYINKTLCLPHFGHDLYRWFWLKSQPSIGVVVWYAPLGLGFGHHGSYAMGHQNMCKTSKIIGCALYVLDLSVAGGICYFA